MKILKKGFVWILIIAMLLPLSSSINVCAEETDHYVNAVLENYVEYLEDSQGYIWLTDNGNYAYEYLAKDIKELNQFEKVIMSTAYWTIGESLTIEDCITYLSTIMLFMDSGMDASIASQAKYDTTKKTSDYVEDGVVLIGDVIGLQEAVNTVKQVQDAIGLTGNTIDMLKSTIDNVEGFVSAMQEYTNHKNFLTVISENATHQELRDAAKVLLALRDYQLAYDLEMAYKQMEDAKQYIIGVGGDVIIGETLADWMKGKEASKFVKDLPKGINTVDDLCTIAKKAYKVGKIIKVAIDGATFVGDIFIGNEYRYLKEIMIMNDIATVLNTAIEQFNPANEKSNHSKYEMIKVQVPFLEALCAVRIRGEYCISMAAKAKDTLFGFIKDKSNKDTTAVEYYDKALALLEREYQMISEIFLVNDYYEYIYEHLWPKLGYANMEQMEITATFDDYANFDATTSKRYWDNRTGLVSADIADFNVDGTLDLLVQYFDKDYANSNFPNSICLYAELYSINNKNEIYLVGTQKIGSSISIEGYHLLSGIIELEEKPYLFVEYEDEGYFIDYNDIDYKLFEFDSDGNFSLKYHIGKTAGGTSGIVYSLLQYENGECVKETVLSADNEYLAYHPETVLALGKNASFSEELAYGFSIIGMNAPQDNYSFIKNPELKQSLIYDIFAQGNYYNTNFISNLVDKTNLKENLNLYETEKSSGYSQSANPTLLDSCYIAHNRIAPIIDRFYRSLSVGACNPTDTNKSPT